MLKSFPDEKEKNQKKKNIESSSTQWPHKY